MGRPGVRALAAQKKQGRASKARLCYFANILTCDILQAAGYQPQKRANSVTGWMAPFALRGFSEGFSWLLFAFRQGTVIYPVSRPWGCDEVPRWDGWCARLKLPSARKYFPHAFGFAPSSSLGNGQLLGESISHD